jgi:hypothetical protein
LNLMMAADRCPSCCCEIMLRLPVSTAHILLSPSGKAVSVEPVPGVASPLLASLLGRLLEQGDGDGQGPPAGGATDEVGRHWTVTRCAVDAVTFNRVAALCLAKCGGDSVGGRLVEGPSKPVFASSTEQSAHHSPGCGTPLVRCSGVWPTSPPPLLPAPEQIERSLAAMRTAVRARRLLAPHIAAGNAACGGRCVAVVLGWRRQPVF